ncbi:MAG TPA: chorismate mutase [Hyphomicrobiaceae bacterium]|nr:chorismate mutase [Hyphomicrobiaceae bacterium]
MRDDPASGKAPKDCFEMHDVRAEIDRIDRALVDLIAERFGYVDRAWQIKQDGTEGAVVPWRIQQVIDRVVERAVQKGVSPALVEALWRQMIGWFIQYEEERLTQHIEKLGQESPKGMPAVHRQKGDGSTENDS